MTDSVADNIARVRERIAAAAVRAGRGPEEVTLVAVTKRHPAQAIREALAAGVRDIGESYVQEARMKRDGLAPDEREAIRWHLLGHLQSNKARQAVPLFDLIQSVDSLRLAQSLARQAQHLGRTLPVLLQVHLGDEETKFGLPLDAALDAAAQVAALDGLDLQGLMGIAPFGGDPRSHFAAMRRLFERLPPSHRRTLSLGMTGDFETAIEEGATMVRIGTAIFGPRQ
ncbi:MAG: YggS family pyridoxal phosphate-dependent enzyme [Armatimonadetes bacterium]|nr:YggS family pyridoxal phosphate-dependent enzyme [Armatimonadota bacterium]